MRVALVHPFAWPDVRRGGERYLDDLAWFLRTNGHDTDVVAGTAGAGRATTTAHGVDRRLRQLPNVTRHPVRLREPETFGVRAYPTLVRHRYDVVHALVPVAALAARAAAQRTVYTFLGHPTDELLQRNPVKKRVLEVVVRTASAITALSENVADDIERHFGRRPVVLPPGVRTDRFTPTSRAEAPTVFYASAMRPEKGIDVLLEAFVRVAARNPKVRLVLSGPGDPQWAFDKVGAALDPYRDRVDDIGPGDPADLPGKYASAHVTVLPSRNEAFGLAFAESLASGTPVVGCRGGGADDIITDEVGRIVDHGDPVALAAAIEETLAMTRDDGIEKRCVARAQLWDWQTSIGPQHLRVYER